MARESKTRYAVLGCLTWQPMSGYDIRRAMERSLGNFWTESFGQIYPTLRQLVKEGLATSRVQPQQGKPDRHEYSITEAGCAALRAWLARPAEPHRYRVEVLIKLLFGRQAGAATALEHVDRFREEHLVLLDEFRTIEARLRRDHAEHPELPYWLLTVRCGLLVSAAFAAWCDEAASVLAGLDEAKPSPGADGGSIMNISDARRPERSGR